MVDDLTSVGDKLYIPYKTWGRLYYPGKFSAALMRRGMDVETAQLIDQAFLDALEDVAFKEEANYRAIEDWQNEYQSTLGAEWIHLLTTSSQSLSSSGEEVEYHTIVSEPAKIGFDSVAAPLTLLTAPQTGLYLIKVYAEWDSFSGGGEVSIVRTRTGFPVDVYTFPGNSGAGSKFNDYHMLPFKAGDGIGIKIASGSGSAEVLVHSELVVTVLYTEPTTTQILDFFSTPTQPDGLAWLSSSLWIACAGDNNIYEYDLDGNQISSFAAGSSGGGLQGMTDHGGNLWVVRDSGGSGGYSGVLKHQTNGTYLGLAFTDPRTGLSANITGIESDGTNIWLTYAGGVIYKVSPSGTILAGPYNTPSPSGNFVQGLHYTGSEFLVTCSTENTIYRVDLSWNLIETYEIIPGAQGPSSAGTQDIIIINGLAYISNSGENGVFVVQL